MYERRDHPLASRRAFVARLLAHVAFAVVLVGGSLAVGVVGYHALAGLGWVDAFLNASMLMGGMGPVDTLHSDAAKLFAGCYAIYCGIALIATTGVILAPVIHRALHKFHLEDDSSA